MRIDSVTNPSVLLARPVTRLAAVARLSARNAKEGPSRTEARQSQQSDSGRNDALDGDSLELSLEAERAVKLEPHQNNPLEMDDAQQQVVQKLKTRDREVRAHEAAHAAAAGPYASGGPNFTYQKGPDGHRYAVGGEVQIDVAPVEGDPEATIRKMQVVRAAALAPAEPSSQDQAVAAAASQQESEAVADLAKQQQNQADSDADGESSQGAETLGKTFDMVA